MSVLWTVVAAGSVSVREGVRESQYFCLFIQF